jgi:hypothetical protein
MNAKIWWSILLALGVCACSGRVPEQKHYVLHTNPAVGGVDVIASETASALKLKTSKANFTMQGGAVSHNIELYGHGFSISIQSSADQQCYSPENKRMTFDRGLYDVNIARTGFLPGRSLIKEMADALSARASQHGATLTDQKVQCGPGKG